MAIPFQRMPGFEAAVPDVRALTQPLQQGLDSYRQGMDAQFKGEMLKKQDARADQEFQLKKQSLEAEREAKFAARMAGVSQHILGMPAEQQASAWGRMVKANPNLPAALQQYGVDPNDHIAGANFIIAQARGYQDPMERKQKQNAIALQGVQIEAARENLANSRADRAAGKVMEVNGRLVRVGPQGASEIYAPPPDAMKAPAGYRWDQGGKLAPIPGGPADTGKNLTEGQTKDAAFAERMLRAEENLDRVVPIDANGNPIKYDPTKKSNAYFPDQSSWKNLWTANAINSKEWQQYHQAARESMAALLRKDTGAAITDQEFDLYFPLYYPQPGDSPEVVKQKKQAREDLAGGLARGSGPAFKRMFPNRAQKIGVDENGAPIPGNWSIQRVD